MEGPWKTAVFMSPFWTKVTPSLLYWQGQSQATQIQGNGTHGNLWTFSECAQLGILELFPAIPDPLLSLTITPGRFSHGSSFLMFCQHWELNLGPYVLWSSALPQSYVLQWILCLSEGVSATR